MSNASFARYLSDELIYLHWGKLFQSLNGSKKKYLFMRLFPPLLLHPYLGKNGRKNDKRTSGLASFHEPARPDMGFHPAFMGRLPIHGQWEHRTDDLSGTGNEQPAIGDRKQ
jgi:hypothetical protein